MNVSECQVLWQAFSFPWPSELWVPHHCTHTHPPTHTHRISPLSGDGLDFKTPGPMPGVLLSPQWETVPGPLLPALCPCLVACFSCCINQPLQTAELLHINSEGWQRFCMKSSFHLRVVLKKPQNSVFKVWINMSRWENGHLTLGRACLFWETSLHVTQELCLHMWPARRDWLANGHSVTDLIVKEI